MFIVLEGIDGSGKSTLAPILAAGCNGVVYATPPRRYAQLRKRVDNGPDLKSHYEFYLEALKDASREIGLLLASGRTVVCDRYWLTTLVYHRAGGMILDGSDFKELIQPDLTLLLLVGPEEQVRRKPSKNISGWQDRLNILYREALVESGLRSITIDTDNLSIKQVSELTLASMLNE